MVVEYCFCSRFTYYEYVMEMPQYEEKRGTVQSGKVLHKNAEVRNKNIIPANIMGRKVNSLKLYSKRHDLVGIVDHAIINDDGIIIIERKYTDSNTVYLTHKVQLGLLAILLEENLKKPVIHADLIFGKNQKHKRQRLYIDDDIKKWALKMLEETKDVITNGVLPDEKFDNRCIDCCYRKSCDVWLLNTR